MGNKSKIIFLVVVLPLVLFLWPSSAGGRTDFMIVYGNSMLPTILPGSLIIIQQEPTYEIDDIVGYVMVQEERARQNVVHRIISYSESEGGFIMQGDNNPKRDTGAYTNEDILGEVKLIVPYAGDALTLMRQPLILIVLVAISAVWQIAQSKKTKRKEQIRKRRLGLVPKPKTDLLPTKKKKKQNYTLFFAAMGMNILILFGTQASISSGIRPQGDALTGFLFQLLDPSIASTLVFFIYFVGLIGFYFIAKKYEMKTELFNQRAFKRGLLLKQKTSGIVIIAQIFWTLFLLVGFLYIVSVWGDFLPIPI